VAINLALITTSMNRREFDAALADVERMLEAAQSDWERAVGLSLRARAFARKGEKVQAMKLLREVVTRYPRERTRMARADLARLEKELVDEPSLDPLPR
jgi:hypothetical protein